MKVINKIKSIIGYILFVLTFLLLFTYLTSCDIGEKTQNKEIKALKIDMDSLRLEIKEYKQKNNELLKEVHSKIKE